MSPHQGSATAETRYLMGKLLVDNLVAHFNGDPLPNSGLRLSAPITPDSILARCGLWIADYHDSPEIPRAWASRSWRLWQYAGDESARHPAYNQTNFVQGVSHSDRNLFNGDAAALEQFWSAPA